MFRRGKRKQAAQKGMISPRCHFFVFCILLFSHSGSVSSAAFPKRIELGPWLALFWYAVFCILFSSRRSRMTEREMHGNSKKSHLVRFAFRPKLSRNRAMADRKILPSSNWSLSAKAVRSV